MSPTRLANACGTVSFSQTRLPSVPNKQINDGDLQAFSVTKNKPEGEIVPLFQRVSSSSRPIRVRSSPKKDSPHLTIKLSDASIPLGPGVPSGCESKTSAAPVAVSILAALRPVYSSAPSWTTTNPPDGENAQLSISRPTGISTGSAPSVRTTTLRSNTNTTRQASSDDPSGTKDR